MHIDCRQDLATHCRVGVYLVQLTPAELQQPQPLGCMQRDTCQQGACASRV